MYAENMATVPQKEGRKQSEPAPVVLSRSRKDTKSNLPSLDMEEES